MKIFLSWSGERGRQVAEVLKVWLVDVCHPLVPWVSSEDIEKGARWDNEISQKLAESNFGIVCLTPENLKAPWLLFEAGALSKCLGSRVCTYLLGLKSSDLENPLLLFQCTIATKDDTFKLLKTINQSLGKNGLAIDRLQRLFEKFWPDLEFQLKVISASAPATKKARSQLEMLDELVMLTRGIDADVRGQKGGLARMMETAIQTNLGKIRLLSADIQPRKIRGGDTLKITYDVQSDFEIPFGVWLGASFRDKTGKLHHDTKQDKQEFIRAGVHKYQRELTVLKDAPKGTHNVGVNIWFGLVGDSNQSKWLQGDMPTPIEIA